MPSPRPVAGSRRPPSSRRPSTWTSGWPPSAATRRGGHGHQGPGEPGSARIRALADGFGLTVGALHAPCLLLTRKVWGTDPIGEDRSLRRGGDRRRHPGGRRAPPVSLAARVPSLAHRGPAEPRGTNRRRRRRREHVPGPIGGQGRDVPFEPGSRTARGPPPPRPRHVPCGRREARSDRGPEAVRGAPPTRPPLRQRREGMGLPPAARARACSISTASSKISRRRGSTAPCRWRWISGLRWVTLTRSRPR